MKLFKITPKIEVVCQSENTRSGFRHVAHLIIDGEQEDETAKCCYLNRTWERYQFQSVLYKLVENSKILSEEEKKVCNEFIKGDHTDWSGFKTTSTIAKLGELFCDNQKDKNDWKTRMLKAGIQGIDIPNDWDSLDEDTKTARLDQVIALMGEKK